MSWVVTVILAAVALIAAGIVYQQLGAMKSRREFPPPGTLFDVGGRCLHCRCAGSGKPAVVFEAGIAASSVSWSLVQPEVAEFTRACSYDRAGLAWSDPGPKVRSIPGFVSELRRLLEQADLQPPYVLVGHSFGGMIIRAFARAYRQDVAGLVFVDTLHPEEWVDPTREQRRMVRGGVFLSRIGSGLARMGVVRLCLSLLSGGRPSVPRRFSRMFGSTASALLEHIVGEVQKLPAEVLPSVQAHWSSPRAFRGMSQHLASVPLCAEQMAADTDAFGDLPIVTLSAANRRARWLAADTALAQTSTRGRHIVSKKGAHWMQLDDPSLVVDAVREVVLQARADVRAPHKGTERLTLVDARRAAGGLLRRSRKQSPVQIRSGQLLDTWAFLVALYLHFYQGNGDKRAEVDHETVSAAGFFSATAGGEEAVMAGA